MRSRWQAPRGPREVAAPQSARGAAAAGSWLMRGAVIAGMAGWAPVGKAATGASVALFTLAWTVLNEQHAGTPRARVKLNRKSSF